MMASLSALQSGTTLVLLHGLASNSTRWWHFAARSRLPPLAGVRVPALVLLSRHSTMTDPARTRAILGALPEMQFTVLEAEHWIPTEQPEAMRISIEAWLAANAARL